MHTTETAVRPQRTAAERAGTDAVLPPARDPHAGPVPESALRADAATRERGRVQMLNATADGGLDGWTLDLPRYELLSAHILDTIDELAGDDGTVSLPDVVDRAQARYATHELFPGGRLRNYVRFTKIDLEARCVIERIPGSAPERIRRWQGPVPAPLVD